MTRSYFQIVAGTTLVIISMAMSFVLPAVDNASHDMEFVIEFDS
jgi:hypothetical protein